ncbi:MAG: single-stranded DNA-binding protein [Spirochaetales bacterium]|nr:single-stranded DNA-binding protein [Spirochaetales bacterium]
MASLRVIKAAARLKTETAPLSFGGKVHTVYNPLNYAWELHKIFLERYGEGTKKILFLGMNPGPWGMAQTGIPFGEINAVREWFKIEGGVSQPPVIHPKRPIEGLACTRSEVSGRRFWGLMMEKFGSPEGFFKEHWVVNYCPLVFMEESGRNYTPDKLPVAERSPLYAICDKHLAAVIEAVQPEKLVGVGKFAMACFHRLYSPGGILHGTAQPDTDWILHPSPANPHANRGWAEAAVKKMKELGIWE